MGGIAGVDSISSIRKTVGTGTDPDIIIFETVYLVNEINKSGSDRM